MSLTVHSVAKKFGRFPALNGASFVAPQGGFVSLLGPSGSGKTTLLRILGGLEFSDSGSVHFADLNWLDMPGLEARYPSQLSGGQRQRVALARALAIEPRMLLLDEPFGALDAKVRKELRTDLRRIHDHAGVTTVFVTHDQEEAFAVADLVAVMKDGRIEQYGVPADVRRNPKTAFVSEFLSA